MAGAEVSGAAEERSDPRFDVPWFLGFSTGGDSTRRSYRFLLGWMERELGRPVAGATVRDLETLKAKLRTMDSGLQFVRVLRMFYLRCAKASSDPAQRFRFEQLADAAVMKAKKPRMDPSDILSPDEVNLLINAALTLRDRALFGLLYETGCRISEALALNWTDVTYEAATDGRPETFVVWFRTMKITGSEHQGFVIDTAPVFKAWTEARPAEAKAVFCTDRGEGRVRSAREQRRLAPGEPRRHPGRNHQERPPAQLPTRESDAPARVGVDRGPGQGAARVVAGISDARPLLAPHRRRRAASPPSVQGIQGSGPRGPDVHLPAGSRSTRPGEAARWRAPPRGAALRVAVSDVPCSERGPCGVL